MIVPTLRLVVCYALILPPLAILPALGQGAGFLALAIGLGLIAAALIDGACAGLGSRGIEVRLPSLVRMVKGRVGALEIGVENGRTATAAIRVGLPMPAEIASSLEFLIASVPAGVSGARLLWPCTPLSRGRFQIDACYLETRSFLGLWAFRKRHEGGCEIRVYPSLENERKGLAALFLNRGSLGIHARRQQGKGKDFERLREYVAGDGYEDIHWKATAKRGHPVTKIFQMERTQEIYVIVDASRLSARLAPGGLTILERFITAGLVLGLAAQQQGDLFGLITFSDRIENFVRAKNGRSHYNLCRDAIYALHPRQATPDFDELATFIRLRLRRRALLVILTSLDDPVLAESFVRDMDLICRQHVILVNMMQSPEIGPMFSGPAAARLDDLYHHLGAHILWNNLRQLQILLQRRGVRFSLLQNEALSAQLITQYMTVKRRQML